MSHIKQEWPPDLCVLGIDACDFLSPMELVKGNAMMQWEEWTEMEDEERNNHGYVN